LQVEELRIAGPGLGQFMKEIVQEKEVVEEVAERQ
jgi:hypothetical protein